MVTRLEECFVLFLIHRLRHQVTMKLDPTFIRPLSERGDGSPDIHEILDSGSGRFWATALLPSRGVRSRTIQVFQARHRPEDLLRPAGRLSPNFEKL